MDIKTGWLDAPLAFWNLAESFKYNAIYLVFTIYQIIKHCYNNEHNDLLLLLFDGVWKMKADYMV